MKSESKALGQSITLPSISAARSLPVAARKAADEFEVKSRKKKRRRRRRQATPDSSRDPDQEADARRQAHLDQRHLEAYRNMHRLRDVLRLRYAALLRDKVRSQRLMLQQRYQRDTARPERTEQKQKKLAFSRLQHDDSHLKSLPKSSHHLIFELQMQLAQQGHLKTAHDLETFYKSFDYSDHPSKLCESVESVRKKMLNSNRSAADSMTHQTSDERPCDAGDKSCEEDSVSLSRLSLSGESSLKPTVRGNQETSEFEQMFPKMIPIDEMINEGYVWHQQMRMPTFATLQPDFMRSFRSRMPDLIIPEIPEKSRKAEVYLRLLRQMHQLCLSNMAFTQRLLDRQTDSLGWQQQQADHDSEIAAINSKQRKLSNQPPPCSPKQPETDLPSRPQHLSTVISTSVQRPSRVLLKPQVLNPLSMCVNRSTQRSKLW